MSSRASLIFLSLLVLCTLGAARRGPARNAILFIGDGMGISSVTAARIHGPGPGGRLAMELPHAALVRTYSRDRLVTDSAAGATALLAGQRVFSGVVGMSSATLRACSLAKRLDGTPNPHHPCAAAAQPIPSLADLAARAGMAVGLVTTTSITHATPAALYAHVDERNREPEIALQLVARQDLSIVVGGGRELFVGRPDGRDLLGELREQGVTVAESGTALHAAVDEGAPRVVALLAPGYLPFELDRYAQAEQDETDLPSLAQLTELAIRHLSRSKAGYFLLVEGGRIDHAQHVNRAVAALVETLALDEAVATARRLTDPKDTLILVTADHGHPVVIAGSATLEDGVLGLARGRGVEMQDVDDDGLPDLLHDMNGEPFPTLLFANGPKSKLRLLYSTHEGSDVMAAAIGPGADSVRGFMELTELHRVLRNALGL